MSKEEFFCCPNGHGFLKEWSGRKRCYTCGWPDEAAVNKWRSRGGKPILRLCSQCGEDVTISPVGKCSHCGFILERLSESKKANQGQLATVKGTGESMSAQLAREKRNAPLTFKESSYWWLWIPVIGWIPFAIPLVLPLGPIMIGFSFSNKMRFVWESANHNKDTLPDGIGAFIGGLYTLGYNTVWRTYRAAKKMMAEEGRGDSPIPGWNPIFLPVYILCPALVFMPLIKAMRNHWQWHLQQRELHG